VNFSARVESEEILAGLAAVHAQNVFLYVASIPNLAALGSRFVWQGGTRTIGGGESRSRFHQRQLPCRWQTAGSHCSRALRRIWPIGAAQESLRCGATACRPLSSALMPSVRSNTHHAQRENPPAISARTLLRTFIDIRTEKPAEPQDFVPIAKVTKVPLMQASSG